MNSYLYGLATPFVAYLIILFAARQWRALWHWYIGLPITKWWTMSLLVFSMKLMPSTAFHTMKANGRMWISPKNHFFEDPETVK